MNNLDLIIESTYDSILHLDANIRGYIFFMRDAFSDKEGSYAISFGYIPIDNPNNLIISDDHPGDQAMLDFLENNYPRFFAVPFVKYRSLDPAKLDGQNFQLAEITQASREMIDTFFFADNEVGIMAKVIKDAFYQVIYSKTCTLDRKDYIEYFPGQYEAYKVATHGLHRRLNCLSV